MVIEKMAVVVCSRKIFDVDIAWREEENGGKMINVYSMFYCKSSLIKIIFGNSFLHSA